MMNSRESEYSHRRQYGDRGTRQWNDYDDGRKERRGHHSDMPRDSYYKYGRDPHTSTEKTRGNREYSDSPKRMYSKDSNRDRSRKSSGRRHSPSSVTPEEDITWKREYSKREENGERMQRNREFQFVNQFSTESKTSPEWSASDKKRRRFTGDVEDDYKYRQKHEDITCRQSPNNFTHTHPAKDFKRSLPPQEDSEYRRTPKDSKRRQHEEFNHRRQPEDFAYHRPSEYYEDGHFEERNSDLQQERTRSQAFPTKSHAKFRDRNDSRSPDYEDHRQTRTRFSMKESSRQVLDVTNHSSVLAGSRDEQRTASKGFQRFLDVLNKGVDVTMLTKIVSQPSTQSDDSLQSPTSLRNTAGDLSSPGCTRQQQKHKNPLYWSESEGSHRQAASQQGNSHLSSEGRRSDFLSPKERSLSDEKSLQRNDLEGRHLNSNSRSISPPEVDKTEVTPEDEHKRQQIRDVLQAIGVDLGFEELGQMSDRIQERLYGKKDSDRCHGHKERRESERTQGCHSRSSSSGRSSFGPLTHQFSLKHDSYKAQKDTAEVPLTEHAPAADKSSSSSLQDTDTDGNKSHESAVAFHLYSPNNTYTVSEPPPPVPAMPTYPAAHYPPYTYPVAAPAVPPNWGVPPGSTPFPPHPHLPAYLPYPSAQALNTFQPASAHSNTLPQCNSSHQLTYLNVQDSNPGQPLNTTQKSKTLSRPRFLQVIDTK